MGGIFSDTSPLTFIFHLIIPLIIILIITIVKILTRMIQFRHMFFFLFFWNFPIFYIWIPFNFNRKHCKIHYFLLHNCQQSLERQQWYLIPSSFWPKQHCSHTNIIFLLAHLLSPTEKDTVFLRKQLFSIPRSELPILVCIHHLHELAW